MKIENDYPYVYKRVSRFLIIRKIILGIFAIGLITCFIVNLSVGGKWWFLYVLGGEIIFYYAFLNKPLIDNVLIKRISIIVAVSMAYLAVIDKINTTDWSYFVIDIIAFSLLILQLIFFFINYEHHKNKVILMLFTSLISIIICLLAIVKVLPINWAIITVGSIGLLNILILSTFYFKTTLLEIRKYFNLK